jgi:hypothetical protein
MRREGRASLIDVEFRMKPKVYLESVDALHIAIATVHGMDYLLTWNCRHIANAAMRNSLGAICQAAGYEIPVICTPLELFQERPSD